MTPAQLGQPVLMHYHSFGQELFPTIQHEALWSNLRPIPLPFGLPGRRDWAPPCYNLFSVLTFPRIYRGKSGRWVIFVPKVFGLAVTWASLLLMCIPQRKSDPGNQRKEQKKADVLEMLRRCSDAAWGTHLAPRWQQRHTASVWWGHTMLSYWTLRTKTGEQTFSGVNFWENTFFSSKERAPVGLLPSVREMCQNCPELVSSWHLKAAPCLPSMKKGCSGSALICPLHGFHLACCSFFKVFNCFVLLYFLLWNNKAVCWGEHTLFNLLCRSEK